MLSLRDFLILKKSLKAEHRKIKQLCIEKDSS